MLILFLIFVHLNVFLFPFVFYYQMYLFQPILMRIHLCNSFYILNVQYYSLNEEISESISTCFTGKISRLINCLCGFSQCVMIYISDSEQIYNIISIAKLKFTDLNYVKPYVKQELIERNYNIDIIDEW